MGSPLPATPRLVRIAESMWWNGPPWTILRNRNAFLVHAMDWAFEEDVEYLLEAIPREQWIAMFETLRPGLVSARSYRYCRWRLGNNDPLPDEWQQRSHIKDRVFEYDPVRVENGVLVAHPVDILANKLGTLSSRKLTRDFLDVAAAHLEMPELLGEAIKAYVRNPMTRESTQSDMAKTILQYPFHVEYELPPHSAEALEALARSLQPQNPIQEP